MNGANYSGFGGHQVAQGVGQIVPADSFFIDVGFENIARAMTQGLELTASVDLPGGFSLAGETTLLQTRDKTTGESLLNRPSFLNNIKFGYADPQSGIRANLRITTVGRRRISERYEADSYTFVHLYGAKRLSRSLEFFAGINNLFNNDPNLYGYLEGAGSMGAFLYTGLSFELKER